MKKNIFLMSRELQKTLDKLTNTLITKQSRLEYLSSFFKTTKIKIEAIRQRIIEDDERLKAEEERSKFKLIIISFIGFYFNRKTN